MKMWKAMIKGAKLGPQLFNQQQDGLGGSCAYGSIVLGFQGLINNWTIENTESVIFRTPMTICFSCGTTVGLNGGWIQKFDSLPSILIHLNNDHKWTREAIAEWVKTFEDKETRDKWNKRKIQQVKQNKTSLPKQAEGVKELCRIQ